MELARLSPFAQYWEITGSKSSLIQVQILPLFISEYFMSLSLSFFINNGTAISPACLSRVSNQMLPIKCIYRTRAKMVSNTLGEWHLWILFFERLGFDFPRGSSFLSPLKFVNLIGQKSFSCLPTSSSLLAIPEAASKSYRSTQNRNDPHWALGWKRAGLLSVFPPPFFCLQII